MADRLDAFLGVLQPGNALVGNAGGGLEITRTADAASELISNVAYLAAALPLEGRLIHTSIAQCHPTGLPPIGTSGMVIRPSEGRLITRPAKRRGRSPASSLSFGVEVRRE